MKHLRVILRLYQFGLTIALLCVVAGVSANILGWPLVQALAVIGVSIGVGLVLCGTLVILWSL